MTFLGKILRKILSSILFVHENDNLVVVDLIEELTEHRDLLIFLDLNVELFKTVQHKLGVITDEDFELILEESGASLLALIGHSTTEHHDLFLSGKLVEDGLNVSSHLGVVEDLIAFVNNEVLDVLGINHLRRSLEKREASARSGNKNVGLLGFQSMDVYRFFNSTINSLDLEVSVLA